MVYTNEKANCLCFDVGGSSVKYALIDIERNMTEYHKIHISYDDVNTYLSNLESVYRNYQDKVSAISLSVPGIINIEQGICIDGGSVTCAYGLHLVEELEKRCKVPVFIMNDAKCAALAESTWGALKEYRNSVVLVLGTGVGGAFILDGEIYTGSNYAAGELSYITLNKEIEDTGNLLWGRIGNQKLLHMAAKVKNIENISDINGENIFKWLAENDEKIIQVFDSFTKEIAQLIMNLQFILDPECFAIGGGISRQPLLLSYIMRNMDYLYSIYPYKVKKAKVVTCKYYNEANLFGAYANYLNRKDV